MEPNQLRDLTPLGPNRVFSALAPDGQRVVLKTFSLQQAASWKQLELFEREARLLSRFDHPRLPRLLAWSLNPPELWLITEWIPGESLAARLAAGWRPQEAQVRDLARQLLGILIGLHGCQPPIVHRDLKPANLILNADGELFLIDFGSALLRLSPDGGSTVAGTFGYMAPEQLTGRAFPASDLYALGATLVHLLSGRSPAELPQERLRLAFETYVACSPALTSWLQRLLAPIPEDRFASAHEALQALEQPAELMLAGLEPPPLPAIGLPLRVESGADGIEVVLPARGLAPERLRVYLRRQSLYKGWPLALPLLLAIEEEALTQPLCLLAIVLVYLGWVGGREYAAYRRMTGASVRLRLRAEELLIERSVGGRSECRAIPRPTVKAVLCEEDSWYPLETGVRIQARFTQPHALNFVRLGQTLGREEQEWLCRLLLRWKNAAGSEDAAP